MHQMKGGQRNHSPTLFQNLPLDPATSAILKKRTNFTLEVFLIIFVTGIFKETNYEKWKPMLMFPSRMRVKFCSHMVLIVFTINLDQQKSGRSKERQRVGKRNNMDIKFVKRSFMKASGGYLIFLSVLSRELRAWYLP